MGVQTGAVKKTPPSALLCVSHCSRDTGSGGDKDVIHPAYIGDQEEIGPGSIMNRFVCELLTM